MPRGHTHDITHASANTGNTLGERSSVRQSKLYRLYESGNATKDLLGSGHLQWSTTRKQGVYEGHDIYDHNHPTNEIDACKYKTKNHQRSPMTTSTVTEKYTPAYNENLSDSFNQMSARARQGRFVSKQQQQAPENIKNLSPPRSKSYNHDVDFGDISSDQNLRDMARTKPSPNRNLYRARDIHRAGAEEVSSDLTANERVKAREAAVARLAATKGISSPPATHTTRAPQGIDVSQSLGRVASNDLYRERWGHGGKGSEPGLPSETREDESIYGPGGQEAFMDRLDHLDDDELGRLTKGLQHLKDMAVEAQRRDKLAKLRGELAQLEAYASPQSSPIYNKQSKSSPLLESGERTHVHFTKNSTGADSPKGILKNALRSSPNSQDRLVTINGSNLHDSYQKIHAECRPLMPRPARQSTSLKLSSKPTLTPQSSITQTSRAWERATCTRCTLTQMALKQMWRGSSPERRGSGTSTRISIPIRDSITAQEARRVLTEVIAIDRIKSFRPIRLAMPEGDTMWHLQLSRRVRYQHICGPKLPTTRCSRTKLLLSRPYG